MTTQAQQSWTGEPTRSQRRAPGGSRGKPFFALVEQLSRNSVTKHFEAYRDVDWDCHEFRISADDPRWQLSDSDLLGSHAWYRAQAAEVQSRIGLQIVANQMKLGLQFESLLQRGLLEFAFGLPNRSPEFRYVYHEVIEEAQHSLMFQEFINRSGLDSAGLSGVMNHLSRQIVRFGRLFPELFFMFVLGGEDPIDRVQREALHGERAIHPLHARVMQIHVMEEARHLCFAEQYLREHVPKLSATRTFVLKVAAPIILAVMARLMLQPTPQLARSCGIPRQVLRQTYANNPRHRAKIVEATAKLRKLCEELGLLTSRSARLWRWLGLVGQAAEQRQKPRPPLRGERSA